MHFSDNYSPVDKALYRLAFNLDIAQHTLADIENSIYGNDLPKVTSPVFVASLPRAGTTILLRIVYQTGYFASHTFSDLPFVLAPILWGNFHNTFGGNQQEMERAHQDGIRVSASKPAALEEVVWKHYFGEHYDGAKIRVWEREDEDAQFNSFFAKHIRKVKYLYTKTSSTETRYLSKNNLNISRLQSNTPLRDGIVLIPFRKPIQQALSMHNQHRHLKKLHAADSFMKEYMEGVGHFEFGEALRPIDFNNWLPCDYPPEQIGFWLMYWIQAYKYVIENMPENAILFSYDFLVQKPEEALGSLAAAIQIPAEKLINQADFVSPPEEHSLNGAIPETMIDEAEQLFHELKNHGQAIA